MKNKVIIITGAGKGIGEAIAKTLAKEGAILALNARTMSDLERVKADISSELPEATTMLYPGDVKDFQFVQKTVQDVIQKFGRIDVLINNAGVCPRFSLLQEFSQEDIHNTVDINLKGPMYWMHGVVPQMVHQGGGTIINMNSIAGKVAYPYSSVYCATKFGLHALGECVSLEQRENKIKVIGIYPGEVKTPLWNIADPGVEHPQELMLTPQDIAEAVKYAILQPDNTWVKDVTVLPLQSPPH